MKAADIRAAQESGAVLALKAPYAGTQRVRVVGESSGSGRDLYWFCVDADTGEDSVIHTYVKGRMRPLESRKIKSHMLLGHWDEVVARNQSEGS